MSVIPMSVVMLGSSYLRPRHGVSSSVGDSYAYDPSYLSGSIAALSDAQAGGRNKTRLLAMINNCIDKGWVTGTTEQQFSQALKYAIQWYDAEKKPVSGGQTAGQFATDLLKNNPNIISDVSGLALALQGKSPEDTAAIKKALEGLSN